jgi:hypothetical protein
MVELREKSVETSGIRRGKRERRTGESKKSEPRRRRADLRVPDGRFQKDQTPGSGVTFHVLISSSSVIPRKSSRNDPKHLMRRQPRTRVTDKNFYSREVGRFSALFLVFCFCFCTLRNCFFLTGLGYKLAGDIACKRLIGPITLFFSLFFALLISCVLVRRAIICTFSLKNFLLRRSPRERFRNSWTA